MFLMEVDAEVGTCGPLLGTCGPLLRTVATSHWTSFLITGLHQMQTSGTHLCSDLYRQCCLWLTLQKGHFVHDLLNFDVCVDL